MKLQKILKKYGKTTVEFMPLKEKTYIRKSNKNKKTKRPM